MTKLGRPAILRPKAIEAVAANPGAKFCEVFAAVGGKRRSLSSVLYQLIEARIVFAAGTSKHHRRYFSREEDASAWLDSLPQATRRKLAWQRDYKRRQYKAKIALLPPKVPKPPKPKPAPKVAKPKTAPVVTRKAGSIIRIEASPPKKGPAYLAGPLVFTDQTRRVVCPSPPRPTRSNTYATA